MICGLSVPACSWATQLDPGWDIQSARRTERAYSRKMNRFQYSEWARGSSLNRTTAFLRIEQSPIFLKLKSPPALRNRKTYILSEFATAPSDAPHLKEVRIAAGPSDQESL